MAYRVSRERFETLVGEALEMLPEEFRQRFKNITVVVEDYPSKEEARSVGVPRNELLGLFSGSPVQQQGGFFDLPPPLPDEIALFQKNIEEICADEEDLVEEIRKTVLHEVGHYFGFSDDDLEEYE